MPKEFDKLAKQVEAKGSAANPFAVARKVLGTDAQIKARRGTGSKSKAGDRRIRSGGRVSMGYVQRKKGC